MNDRLQTELFGSYFSYFLPRSYSYETVNELKCPQSVKFSLQPRWADFFRRHQTLMVSQILLGWISKNFDLLGVVVFQGRRHTCCMSRS